MKSLFEKRWFRRLCQTGMVLISLLAVAWMAINWHGARLRRDAIAKLEAHGLPRDLSDILNDLPPETSNYAMIPLLKQAREEMVAETPGDAAARLKALHHDDFWKARTPVGKGGNGEPDFSYLPDGSPFGKTAGSFLAEYEKRNGATLEELSAALSLPETRLSLGGAPGTDWFSMSEEMGVTLMQGGKGIGLRAYAAIVTGDSAKAAESIAVLLRIGEVVGSRGFAVSVAVERVMIQLAGERLKQGMARHLWTPADLALLRASFARIRLRDEAARDAGFAVRIWLDSWSNWQRDRDTYRRVTGTTDDAVWKRCVSSLAPSGWFDMNGAACVDGWLELEPVIRTSRPMAPWILKARELSDRSAGRRALARFLKPDVDKDELKFLTQFLVHAEVVRQMSLLACDLEAHRLANGIYPATLAELPKTTPLDPLHEKSFIYRREGDFFLLYSTGPDGCDDGGKAAKTKGSLQQPDWVW